MPIRSNDILTVSIFILTLAISLSTFSIINARTAYGILTGYSNSIYLITQKEAELIQMKYFRSDTLFRSLKYGRTPDLTVPLRAIQRTYPFFETLELVREPLLFAGQYYILQASGDNRLNIDFRVAKYRGDEYIEGLLAALNVTRDFFLSDGPRSRNVADISHYLGKKLNLKRKRLKDLKIAACLHDIGKISVPMEILNSDEPCVLLR